MVQKLISITLLQRVEILLLAAVCSCGEFTASNQNPIDAIRDLVPTDAGEVIVLTGAYLVNRRVYF